MLAQIFSKTNEFGFKNAMMYDNSTYNAYHNQDAPKNDTIRLQDLNQN